MYREALLLTATVKLLLGGWVCASLLMWFFYQSWTKKDRTLTFFLKITSSSAIRDVFNVHLSIVLLVYYLKVLSRIPFLDYI